MLRTSWTLALCLLGCATTSPSQTRVAQDGPESEQTIPAQPAVVAIPNARHQPNAEHARRFDAEVLRFLRAR